MTSVTGLWEYSSERITNMVAATCKISAVSGLMVLFFCFPVNYNGFSPVYASGKSAWDADCIMHITGIECKDV
jgi:hypothetical protein